MELLTLGALSMFLGAILMIRDADRQMKANGTAGTTTKVARPAAREGIHISLVTDNASKRTFRGMWIETRTGSTVIELTPQRAVAVPSVN